MSKLLRPSLRGFSDLSLSGRVQCWNKKKKKKLDKLTTKSVWEALADVRAEDVDERG